MLKDFLRLDNWARAAGFAATLFAAIVCSFLWAISYPPLPSGGPITQHNQPSTNTEHQPTNNGERGSESNPLVVRTIPAEKGTPEAERDEKERHEKAANERGLTVGTWVLAFATILLFAAVAIQAILFIWQLRLIQDGGRDTRKAADAAVLSAEAIMAANGAHIYPVIKKTNLKEVFSGTTLYPSIPDDDPVPDATVKYVLKNYGKTPAIIEHISNGMAFYPPGARAMTTVSIAHQPLGIIVDNGETAEIACEIQRTLTYGEAKAVLARKGELIFFGDVTFRDFFNRTFHCHWEFRGRPDGFHLYKIEETRKQQS